jgi:hypothetical protein
MDGITNEDVDYFFGEGLDAITRGTKKNRNMIRATPFAACMNAHTYATSDVTEQQCLFYPFHCPANVVPGLPHLAETDAQYYTDNMTSGLLANYVAVRNHPRRTID